MSQITTINGSDLPSNSRGDINTNFANLNSDKLETSYLDTDTSLAANSDEKIATQKAVKTYIDTSGGKNASTTVRGIVEEATQAEVDAGTAAGATGARLFINPSTPPTGVLKSVTAGATINGATLPVPVYQNKTDNEFYACDANDTAAMKFLGFAVSNGTDGASFNVKFTGIVSGFTGLDEGEKYYVQDTVGTIGTSPGTYEVLVGVAISTTELLIMKGRRRASGIITLSATGNTTVTTGFRVSKVVIHGVFESSGPGVSNGGWTKFGGNSCVRVFYSADAPDAGASSSSSLAFDVRAQDSNPFGASGTVSSVTDTTFVINTASWSSTVYLFWEAEGDF